MAPEMVRIEVDQQVSLEGIFEPGQAGAAMVLHPHPLFGGSMNNNVVHALRQAAQSAGFAALSFNFRGVGCSSGSHDQGRGEQDDVAAAAAWLAQQAPGPLVLLGYSFGAWVGSQAAASVPGLAGAAWVAPPWAMMPLAPWPQGLGRLLILAGEADQFGDAPKLAAYAQEGGALITLETLPGVDHFWQGAESALTEKVTGFLVELAGQGEK